MPISIPSDIAHIIQLAIAPVFLLAGIGAFLNVMANRLSRVVDRWRKVEGFMAELDESSRQIHVPELAAIDQRMILINRAVILSTLSALLICLVVVTLFTGQVVKMDVSNAVAALFVASMGVLIAGLVYFLAEISVATRTLRVAPHLIPSHKSRHKKKAPPESGDA
ncbi:DUF2721 domain-containing protein [Hyphomonas sp.]|jgi:hypothetical protein|uniref:DUF2721 domain-containing protein n=1 Tax=Hyphomonas sp. TaxID=87 RepID=UPI00356A97CA